MIGRFCCIDGNLVPVTEAVIPADDIQFAYGYGVYESLKVRKSLLYFPDLHIERLLHSARIIGLECRWSVGEVMEFLRDLVGANGLENANIKILLLGGNRRSGERLYIMELPPLFPPRLNYSRGHVAILFEGERHYPQAKSLSMLLSSVAFRKAADHDAYDAILVDRNGNCTEGTRTNLFYTDGKTLFTPPEHQVLSGVTRLTLIQALKTEGLDVTERMLSRSELPDLAGMFLSSTSSKVMPIRRIEDHGYGSRLEAPAEPGSGPARTVEFEIPDIVRRTARIYDSYLEQYRSSLEKKNAGPEGPA